MQIPDFDRYDSPVAIVMHDAGAANLIISWLKKTKFQEFRVHAVGPAQKIWEEEFPSIPLQTLDDALSKSQVLVSGTGWASDIEHEARCMAMSIGMHSIAVIDHWVNYRCRFQRNSIEVLPDEIWVSDSYALSKARAEIPELPSSIFENTYLLHLQNSIKSCELIIDTSTLASKRILYILEPIREKWCVESSQLGEFQALEYFISRMADLGLSEDSEIRIRPHPSDAAGKYDDWISTHSLLSVALDDHHSMSESIAWANIVAGCESFALVVALSAGKKTISTLPPWAHELRLPHRDIIRLCHI